MRTQGGGLRRQIKSWTPDHVGGDKLHIAMTSFEVGVPIVDVAMTSFEVGVSIVDVPVTSFDVVVKGLDGGSDGR